MMTIQELREVLSNDLKKAFPEVDINERYEFVNRMKSPFINQIFILGEKYHCYETGMRESECFDYITEKYDDLLWFVANNLVRNVVIQHDKNMSYEEYYKLLDKKQIELMTKISKEFGERKRREIEERRSRQ